MKTMLGEEALQYAIEIANAMTKPSECVKSLREVMNIALPQRKRSVLAAELPRFYRLRSEVRISFNFR